MGFHMMGPLLQTHCENVQSFPRSESTIWGVGDVAGMIAEYWERMIILFVDKPIIQS